MHTAPWYRNIDRLRRIKLHITLALKIFDSNDYFIIKFQVTRFSLMFIETVCCSQTFFGASSAISHPIDIIVFSFSNNLLFFINIYRVYFRRMFNQKLVIFANFLQVSIKLSTPITRKLKYSETFTGILTKVFHHSINRKRVIRQKLEVQIIFFFLFPLNGS